MAPEELSGTARVGGFELPREVVSLVGQRQWTAHVEGERLPSGSVETVFGEVPDPSWAFYDLSEMREVTEAWVGERDPVWLGVAPDDLDPASSVLIGELGYDRPFALDFRSAEPVVRFLTIDGRWVVVASSFTELLQALGIDQRARW